MSISLSFTVYNKNINTHIKVKNYLFKKKKFPIHFNTFEYRKMG